MVCRANVVARGNKTQVYILYHFSSSTYIFVVYITHFQPIIYLCWSFVITHILTLYVMSKIVVI